MSFTERRWPEVAAAEASCSTAGMSYHAAATALNAPTVTQVYSRRLNKFDILAEIVVGSPANALEQLTAAKAVYTLLDTSDDVDIAILRPKLDAIESNGGVDLGNAMTRVLLQAKAPAVFTPEQVAGLLALAERKISPAQKVGLPTVTAGMIQCARGELPDYVGGV